MDGGAWDLSESDNLTTLAPWANRTFQDLGDNLTTLTSIDNVTAVQVDHAISFPKQIVLTKAFFLGFIGNALALMFLMGFCQAKPPRNSKHKLMLISLAANDLVAVVGMTVFVVVKKIGYSKIKSYCIGLVLWRSFGLASGSIVIVMAVERWLALTRPFFYQKYVTVGALRRSIISFWVIVLILSSMPLFGFGRYWNKDKCVRYKEASNPLEQSYAYLYMVYVLILLVCLVCCNVGVIRALVRSKSTKSNNKKGVLVRRISRNRDLATSSNTAEEIAFARVMGLLCTVFYVCWVPQVVSIPMWHLMPNSYVTKSVTNTADILLLLHFSVDPYFYVLQRWRIFRSLCWRRSNSIRANSTKTTHELVSL